MTSIPLIPTILSLLSRMGNMSGITVTDYASVGLKCVTVGIAAKFLDLHVLAIVTLACEGSDFTIDWNYVIAITLKAKVQLISPQTFNHEIYKLVTPGTILKMRWRWSYVLKKGMNFMAQLSSTCFLYFLEINCSLMLFPCYFNWACCDAIRSCWNHYWDYILTLEVWQEVWNVTMWISYPLAL